MARESQDLDESRRRKAQELLEELGTRARLLVYVASASGAGKTRRLLDDARRLRAAGKNVAIGWIDLKGRPELERLSEGLQRIPPRMVEIEGERFADFDFDRAVELHPDAIVLDELAHDNLPGSAHAKRWQDALALRDRGISVLGAFNVAHLETAAPVAQTALGYPVREIVPVSFLRAADEVIALDVSPSLLKSRLRSGKVVRAEDVDRALDGAFSDRTLYVLRELLLRTIDELTIPAVSAGSASTAAALVLPGVPIEPFLRRTAAMASALDLALQIYYEDSVSPDDVEPTAHDLDAEVLRGNFDERHFDIDALQASLVALPLGKLAKRLANQTLDRDVFIAGVGQTYLATGAGAEERAAREFGDRLRAGYGKLTVFLGPVAGSGKTVAMLDRGHQLQSEGVDVVVGFVETHGRKDTAALVEGLEVIPRKRVVVNGITYEELDRDAVIARKPKVVLIDELAHTNAPGFQARKRYEDVLAILRAGIDVLTTLNIQHLEALTDAVLRLTGTEVRETLPDEILALADEVVLIDVTPETLRERLRDGKIYPPERIDAALANFFRVNNLRALRELAVREAIAAKDRDRVGAPFERLLLTVAPRLSDVDFIERCAKIARRLITEFAVVCVTTPKEPTDESIVRKLRDETERFRGSWIHAVASDKPQKVLEIARTRAETTVAVGGALRNPRWFERGPFARRLIEAGARELLILARRVPGSAPER
jgi:two-component system, OmpR family, sensor histidine kinase KdpD